MLLSTLFQNPLSFIIFVGVLLITLSVHEYAHARAAEELGDPTARLMGRLTLNPLAHIDPIGSLMILLVGFGWGKPVPFDPYNLKNPRKDSAIISLVGPLSNFVMAIVGAVLLRVLMGVDAGILSSLAILVLPFFVQINLVLGLFNLLPFAPLDGFKVVAGIIPEDQAKEWYSLERYGMLFLLAFILPLMGNRSMLDIVLDPAVNYFYNLLVPRLSF